jgi:hypothetical protein
MSKRPGEELAGQPTKRPENGAEVRSRAAAGIRAGVAVGGPAGGANVRQIAACGLTPGSALPMGAPAAAARRRVAWVPADRCWPLLRLSSWRDPTQRRCAAPNPTCAGPRQAARAVQGCARAHCYFPACTAYPGAHTHKSLSTPARAALGELRTPDVHPGFATPTAAVPRLLVYKEAEPLNGLNDLFRAHGEDTVVEVNFI